MKFGAISWKLDILLITASNLKILLHICDKYNSDFLPHTTIGFYFIDFQLNTDFFPQFCGYNCKITWRYSKVGFSTKCFKKKQKPDAFPPQKKV